MQDKLSVGDTIKCIGEKADCTVGGLYKVTEVFTSGGFLIRNDVGNSHYCFLSGGFEKVDEHEISEKTGESMEKSIDKSEEKLFCTIDNTEVGDIVEAYTDREFISISNGDRLEVIDKSSNMILVRTKSRGNIWLYPSRFIHPKHDDNLDHESEELCLDSLEITEGPKVQYLTRTITTVKISGEFTLDQLYEITAKLEEQNDG